MCFDIVLAKDKGDNINLHFDLPRGWRDSGSPVYLVTHVGQQEKWTCRTEFSSRNKSNGEDAVSNSSSMP